MHRLLCQHRMDSDCCTACYDPMEYIVHVIGNVYTWELLDLNQSKAVQMS